jgi:hypothetical protein
VILRAGEEQHPARASALVSLVSALALSCAAAPGEPPPSHEIGAATRHDAGASHAVSLPAAAAQVDAPAPADASSTVHPAPADAGAAPRACADDMVLIDGEYCRDLQMKCLKSWYGTANKKVICERFDSPTQCVGAKEKKRYCIDRYEFPNKKGERPVVMNNFYQSQVLCAALGKRVCTETEWTMACEGPSYKPYPYGYVRDAKKCRGDMPYGFPKREGIVRRDPVELERLWKGVVSGSQPECVSDYGVHDMPGNADELAASEQIHGPRAKFDSVTTGGPWYLGVRNQCRPKIYEHDEGFAYYYLTTRCCAEPDGQPTDPRSPRQKQRGMSWERVVYFAKNSL